MKRAKLNDDGAAMVTVLVVTIFISLLATTLLYIASMNYMQKQTDYQNKQSFYGAEEALDTLRSLLADDVQEAYREAYSSTSKRLLYLGTDADVRLSDFQSGFNSRLEELWDERVGGSDGLTNAVKTLMTNNNVAEDVASRIYYVKDYGTYEVSDSGSGGTTSKFVLRGVRVRYTSESGAYTTFLYADISIEAPAPDFTFDPADTSDGSSSDGGSDSDSGRTLIAFTDYISYMNWQRIDYDYDNYTADDPYYDFDIGTKVTSSSDGGSDDGSSE